MAEIRAYSDFLTAVNEAGFSMGGGNTEGIFAVIPWDWKEEPPYETPICWHNGDFETDPWEWRMRVLEEQRGIAYAKVFFRKSGYITKEWYPYFLAARRGSDTFEDVYAKGTISAGAKRIYECLRNKECTPSGKLPLHDLKKAAGFEKEEKAVFERGLMELQMRLFITMFGRQQKISKDGMLFGWSSTVFGTTEQFWGDEIFQRAAGITRAEAEKRITEQILRLNPEAQAKKIQKFIFG